MLAEVRSPRRAALPVAELPVNLPEVVGRHDAARAALGVRPQELKKGLVAGFAAQRVQELRAVQIHRVHVRAKLVRGVDVAVHGADRQRGYIEDHFPERAGVTTELIAGNHDWSFWQRGGVDILAAVAKARPDIKYHGPMGAKIMVGGVHVYLAHGDGGVAYARSYKPQRRIEQFAPEQKPEIYLLGHYHVWDHLPMYRNVVSFQLGCFQAQTDYLKRKGVYPEIGGLILTIYRGTKGADRPGGFVRVVDEIVPFYTPRTADF